MCWKLLQPIVTDFIHDIECHSYLLTEEDPLPYSYMLQSQEFFEPVHHTEKLLLVMVSTSKQEVDGG